MVESTAKKGREQWVMNKLMSGVIVVQSGALPNIQAILSEKKTEKLVIGKV